MDWMPLPMTDGGQPRHPGARYLSKVIAAIERTRVSSPVLQRVLAAFAMARHRLLARAGLIGVIALVFLALAAVAGLGLGWSVLGFLALSAAVAALPGDLDSGDPSAGGGRSIRAAAGTPRGSQAQSWTVIVDAIPDAVIALDPAGNVMHFNALVRQLFPNVRVGQPMSNVTRNPELNAAVDGALAGADPPAVQFFERVPVERRISATLTRLPGTGSPGTLPTLLAIFRDLTEQDRLAQMRADFIANASHELRTPLASLRGFVETLQGPARDDPSSRDRFLGIMARQAARMTRLIDDLLSLSRIEMRVHLPPRGIVDLNEVAAHVVQALEPVATGAKATLKLNRIDTPARIRGDRDEIVQVAQNLVHNAIKYGREGGTIEVAVARVLDGTPPAPRLLLAVADDGPGIAAEHLPRLTERFYRANVAASREKGGTGLGLAIVKHIVTRHRAELRIASEVGVGSTFTVLFEELSGSATRA